MIKINLSSAFSFAAFVGTLLVPVSAIADTISWESGVVARHRYVDHGDGTVTDRRTRLMWEKKTGTVGSPVFCGAAPDCPDPHNVNNIYSWTGDPSNAPTGTLYTGFLGNLNLVVTDNGELATCFANYCDWRIPTISELRSIVLAPFPDCSSSPCIHPAFGPTQASVYWSSTSRASDLSNVWAIPFNGGSMASYLKSGGANFARAVRGGR